MTLHQSLNKPDVQLAYLNPNSYCIDRSIQENNIAELKAENMVRRKQKKNTRSRFFETTEHQVSLKVAREEQRQQEQKHLRDKQAIKNSKFTCFLTCGTSRQ